MAQIQLSTTNFDKFLVPLIQKRLEEELRAPLPHLLPGNFRAARFVPGTNNTMRFLRVADLPVVVGTPTPGVQPWLTEGTAPSTEDLTIGYQEFSADQAGRLIKLTDKAMQASPIDMFAEAAEKIARNAVETADGRIADILGAGSQVLYAGSPAKTARLDLGIADVVTSTLLRRAVAVLKASNVPSFGDGYYRCIINPAVSFDFQGDTGVGGWMDAARYAGSMPLLTGELGRFAGVRFIESSKAKVFADGGTTIIGANTTAVAATDVITTSVAHNLAVNDKVRFRTITSGGAGLVAGTVYFVKTVPSGTTLTISATLGGATFDITSDLVTSTFGKVNNVYSTTLIAPDAYAFGDWNSIQVFPTPPGGQSDPLHQAALIGWKGYFGGMLIDSAGPRYIRIESGTGL